MKVALIGYGKMGQMFEKTAQQEGIEIVERFIDVRPLKTDESTRKQLDGVSVLVDFSLPEAVWENVESACALGINLVEGTTGWHDRIRDVEDLVCKAGIGMIHAANFSLGVNLFYRIVENAAQCVSAFPQYEPYIEESHHKQKKDAPSGTAIVLKRIVETKSQIKVSIPVTSLRAGYIPGTHIVGFDSAADSIRLEHTARNREGLAAGAVLAAKWIEGKKGFFNFKDVVDQLVITSNGK